MNRKNEFSMTMDLSFPAFLILQAICITFMAADYRHLAYNACMLCLAMGIFILVYLAGIEMGLIFLMPYVAGVTIFHVLEALRTGEAQGRGWFWILWPVASAAVIHQFVKNSRRVEKEKEELIAGMSQFITFDEEAGMHNLLAFERDAKVYMGIAHRYRIKLGLLLWKQDSIDKKNGGLAGISMQLKEGMRKEDLIYIIDKKEGIFGILVFFHDSVELPYIMEEMEQRIGIPDEEKRKSSYLEYESEMMTPLAFLAECRNLLY